MPSSARKTQKSTQKQSVKETNQAPQESNPVLQATTPASTLSAAKPSPTKTGDSKGQQDQSLHQDGDEDEDTLLCTYLNTLDQYTTLQTALRNHLSSGHLSLAKANFHAPPGRRFDGDWFDERVRAALRVCIESQAAGARAEDVIRAVRRPYSKAVRKSAKKSSTTGSGVDIDAAGDNERKESTRHLPTPPTSREGSPTPAFVDSDTLSKGVSRLSVSKDSTDKKPVTDSAGDVSESAKQEGDGGDEEYIPNPLHQFGILVPQALRQAQTGFERALDIMVSVVGVQRELDKLETRIRNARAGREAVQI